MKQFFSMLVLVAGFSILSAPVKAQDVSWSLEDRAVLPTVAGKTGEDYRPTEWAGCDGNPIRKEMGWWPKAQGGQGFVLGMPGIFVADHNGYVTMIAMRPFGTMASIIRVGMFLNCETGEMLPTDSLEVGSFEYIGAEGFYRLSLFYHGTAVRADQLDALGLSVRMAVADLDLDFHLEQNDTLEVATLDGGNPQSIFWARECNPTQVRAECYVFRGNSKSYDIDGFVFQDDRAVGFVGGASWNWDGLDAWVNVQTFAVVAEVATAFRHVTVSTETEEIPQGFSIGVPYPNPTNGPATVPITVDKAQHLRVSVYDLLGREVDVLHNDVVPPGEIRLAFDGSALPNGVYLVRAGRASRSIVLNR